MATSIRELVKERQVEVKSTDLQIGRASEILKELSAIIGNCNDEIRVADVEYSRVLLAYYETEEKANRAKIKAEVTPEYIRRREARDTKELVIEMINSLKYFLRAKSEEYRASGNQ